MSQICVSAMAIVAVAGLSLSNPAIAQQEVSTGKVIRGVTLAGPAGNQGTSTGHPCDFSDEDVNQAGKMTGASVNCKANGAEQQVLAGLPARFNAYCVMNAPVKSARLITAAVNGNNNHCDLSGITPKDAQGQFGGAIWR